MTLFIYMTVPFINLIKSLKMQMGANDVCSYLPPAILQLVSVCRLLSEFLCRLIKTFQPQTGEVCFLACLNLFLRKTRSAGGRLSTKILLISHVALIKM